MTTDEIKADIELIEQVQRADEVDNGARIDAMATVVLAILLDKLDEQAELEKFVKTPCDRPPA